MLPLVSIIIPTHNRAHLIGETLDSVLAQTYHNWECIVVDDGSKDGTDEILRKYIKKDSRVQYYHRPNERPKGANSCRNYGFEVSNGEYINWLDSDDLISRSKIELQVNNLLGQPFNTISICKWYYFTNENIDVDKNTIDNFPIFKSYKSVRKYLDDLSKSGGFLPPHAYLTSREIVESAGQWLDELLINQDGEFFSRIFINTNHIIFTDSCFVLYRRAINENISLLSDRKKALHAIYSWIIIENRFKIKFGESTPIVHISKKYLYQRLRSTYPELIENYCCFFSAQISSKKSLKTILFKFLKKW